MISAPEGNRVLAVGADTRRATVEAELRGLADLDQVRIVTMDMTPHYRDAVRAVLPAATIVADRWHVQKLFVVAAQEARKRFLRTAPAAERPRLKEQHTLVGRRRHALADVERRALDRLLAAAPLLAEAYRLKEGFGAIYDRCHSSSAAIDAYDAWLRSFPQADDDPDSAASRLARDLAALFAGPIAAVEAWLVEVFALVRRALRRQRSTPLAGPRREPQPLAQGSVPGGQRAVAGDAAPAGGVRRRPAPSGAAGRRRSAGRGTVPSGLTGAGLRTRRRARRSRDGHLLAAGARGSTAERARNRR
ncbi:transposase [Azospirillum doebereinerae]|uniref:transposase n=1 Tax=Azospirillum doebereinerae TaxID=92933 RepID=UPI00384B671E